MRSQRDAWQGIAERLALMPKLTPQQRQYAPWSEHLPEEEIPLMTPEQSRAAAEKIAELM
jgi:hypothetical protein